MAVVDLLHKGVNRLKDEEYEPKRIEISKRLYNKIQEEPAVRYSVGKSNTPKFADVELEVRDDRDGVKFIGEAKSVGCSVRILHGSEVRN